MSTSGVDTVTAAARRRQRRLRACLRYARMSVAMALAESTHRTSRGQRIARAGEEGREEHGALRRQRPPPPQPELFQLYEEEPGGSRPACLGEPRGPQEQVQLRTVAFADVVPMVQILDAPVPRGANSWGTSWWKCSERSTLGPRSRLSKCPRSFLTELLSVLWNVVLRRRRNS